MMRLPTRNGIELPFTLEIQLEQRIAVDPEWLAGIEWGQPRPGHPEGKVCCHIQEVLHNIDHFFGNTGDRPKLRLVALIHDTFKYKRSRRQPGAPKKSHGYWARQFAERYIDDVGVLEVIELHDEAYKASFLLTRHGNRAAAEHCARELITRLGQNLDLFIRFYLCDNRTGGKSTAHYNWFSKLAAEHKARDTRQG